MAIIIFYFPKREQKPWNASQSKWSWVLNPEYCDFIVQRAPKTDIYGCSTNQIDSLSKVPSLCLNFLSKMGIKMTVSRWGKVNTNLIFSV